MGFFSLTRAELIYSLDRWHPAVPLAIPHKSVADDEYRGMLIPAGSTVMANARLVPHTLARQLLIHIPLLSARAMTLDESKFSDPQQFIPERFLPKPEGRGEVMLNSLAYGWGSR